MHWLFIILRLVFGRSTTDSSESPRVAIRPDGSTVHVPSEASVFRQQLRRWDWLLPHWIGSRSDDFPPVVDPFEHGFARSELGDSARRQYADESRDR